MVSQAAFADLQSAYRNWGTSKAGNADEVIGLMTDDFTMGSLSGGAYGMRFSRDHVSREQARHYFSELLNEWELNFFHVRDFVVQASEVAVICECSWLHKATRQLVHSPKLDLWKFKGRRAIGYFEFFDTEQAFAAAAGLLSPSAAPPAALYAGTPPRGHEGLDEVQRVNLRKMRRFFKKYEASKGANYPELLAMIAPVASWTSLANGARGLPFTVARTSREQIRTFFEELGKDWEMLSFQMLDIISGGPFIIAYGRVEFRNRHTDKVFSSPKADIFRFEGEQIVEFIEYYDTAGAVRAALPMA
jgi:ketosteroid isomerase-like protein